MFRLLTYLFVCVSSALLSQDTIRIPSTFPTIQEGLNNAGDGTVVLVAPGRYFENIKWPNQDGIALISEAGENETIIDGAQLGRVLDLRGGNNSLHGPQTLTSRTRISGFTITNGLTLQFPGAGLYITNASPRLSNLIISDNIFQGQPGVNRDKGGGAYFIALSGIITNCAFVNNKIYSDHRDLAYGAGVYMELLDDLEMHNCEIINNKIIDAWGGLGTGLYLTTIEGSTEEPEIKMVNCLVAENRSNAQDWSEGVGINIDAEEGLRATLDSCEILNNFSDKSDDHYDSGDAIWSNCSHLSVLNSIIDGNDAVAIMFGIGSRSAVIDKTIISNNGDNTVSLAAITMAYKMSELHISNSVIAHNRGHSIHGSPEENLGEPTSELSLTNCTVAYNLNTLNYNWTKLEAVNSIFWENGTEEITGDSWKGYNSISNCLVKGGIRGDNIIDSDPLFIDKNNLMPSENSPCSGSGTPIWAIKDDILGETRPLPPGTNPDLGAYEISTFPVSGTSELRAYEIAIFPNPTTEQISFSEIVDKIIIFDSTGQQVKEIFNTRYLNVTDLDDGLYLVHLEIANTKTIKKVVVSR